MLWILYCQITFKAALGANYKMTDLEQLWRCLSSRISSSCRLTQRTVILKMLKKFDVRQYTFQDSVGTHFKKNLLSEHRWTSHVCHELYMITHCLSLTELTEYVSNMRKNHVPTNTVLWNIFNFKQLSSWFWSKADDKNRPVTYHHSGEMWWNETVKGLLGARNSITQIYLSS
jgi:hypothetical protein